MAKPLDDMYATLKSVELDFHQFRALAILLVARVRKQITKEEEQILQRVWDAFQPADEEKPFTTLRADPHAIRYVDEPRCQICGQRLYREEWKEVRDGTGMVHVSCYSRRKSLVQPGNKPKFTPEDIAAMRVTSVPPPSGMICGVCGNGFEGSTITYYLSPGATRFYYHAHCVHGPGA